MYPTNPQEAKQSNFMHYFTGRPCKNGHVALRNAKDRSCLECCKEKRKKKYALNPEKFRKIRKEYYLKNQDKEKATAKVRSAEWRKKNKGHEGTKEAKRKWKLNNVAKVRADTIKRRAAKLNRTPAWLTENDYWMMEQAYEIAALRTKLFGFSWHVDHIIPLQGDTVSGLHTPYNLQVIPWFENVSKANKFLPA